MTEAISGSDPVDVGTVSASLDTAEVRAHLATVLLQAAEDETLSAEARALATQNPFAVRSGAPVGTGAEGLAIEFIIAVVMGGGTAAGGLTVNELWAYIKKRLRDEDRANITSVDDKSQS
jgi:hypothetical protein